ncbi:LacI family transcriptional regulator [Labilibaculum sp. DW002]|uniref:LacI family transcriptional regulator n=1 Tax=Paralabilibaculum antarcticum TaxID=2912572 RepID=A0ABT5VPQ9_9BACT|nr:LacI family DNA-binding transcriptional regulator [Labilibaculum sp. DW002]MDE5417430.1 LacI family transcriptional regulator [Labilibaculum sp. DW002]
MKQITIKDVAKKLKCSVSTVSRAFNDKYDIRTETRELILKTATEMGYRPNPIARKLIQQRSFNIGVVVPEFINSFFPEVIIGAQEVLHEQGYQVLIMQSNESSELELKNVQTLLNNMVDGILISLSSETDNMDFYLNAIKEKMPMVFFNRVVEGLPASKVLFDDYKWAFFATEHLIMQGYKDIVHLIGSKDLTLTKNRTKGFEDAHRKHKLSPGKSEVAGFSMNSGECFIEKRIEENSLPQAILASSDPCAIGVMKILKANGFNVPNDIAVMGFSESKLAEHVAPPLSSVEQPTYDMGRTAALLLLEQIKNKGLFVPQSIVLNGRLNIRESSMKL